MEANKLKILLVEDDPNLGSLLKDYLEAKEFQVDLAINGKKGLEKFNQTIYDLAILDVMMPVMDGFTLAKEIRKMDKNMPLIFLTAKSMKDDVLEGFQSGADDYVTKPFNMEELIMRISAIMRRVKNQFQVQSEQAEFPIGGYVFNYKTQILQHGDASQKLTTRESELLKLLCLNANDILDRNFALKTIWGNDNYFSGRSMDVYIVKLRKYLKDDPNVEILNVHGRGFKLLIKNTVQ